MTADELATFLTSVRAEAAARLARLNAVDTGPWVAVRIVGMERSTALRCRPRLPDPAGASPARLPRVTDALSAGGPQWGLPLTRWPAARHMSDGRLRGGEPKQRGGRTFLMGCPPPVRRLVATAGAKTRSG